MLGRRRRRFLGGTCAPWAFVILGVFARLLWLEDIEFKQDEFQALTWGYRMTCGHGSLLGMPSSQGLVQPPLFLHLVALATLISTDPVVVTSFVALANCAAIVAIPWGFRSSIGRPWSAWVAAIMATSPWPVIFSRKLWTQDLLFPAMILFWCAWMSNRRSPATWKVVFASVGLVAASQLHLTGAFAAVAIAVCVVFNEKRLARRDLAIATAIAVLMYAPFVSYHVLDRGQNLSYAISSASNAQPDLLNNVRLSVATATTAGDEFLVGEWVHARLRPVRLVATPWSVLFVVAGVVGCGFEVRAYLQSHREHRRPSARSELCTLLVAGFVSNEWFLMLCGAPAAPHYHIACWPCLAVGFVLCCRRVGSIARRKWHCVAVLMLAGVGVSQSTMMLGLIVSIHIWPTRLTGDYGLPYSQSKAYWTAAISVAREQSDGP